MQFLAEQSGIGYDTIRKMVKGTGHHVLDFDTADRLLVAMGRPDLWLIGPLHDVYMGIDLEYIDRRNPCCDPQLTKLAA